MIPLAPRIDEIAREMAASTAPEVLALYERFIDHLRTSGLAEAALGEGDRLPPFMLANAEGRLVSSQELLERGPIVICFFRGHWCPICNVELAALGEALEEIEAKGATLVTVTPEVSGYPAAAKSGCGGRFEVLSDPDNGFGLECGVVFRVPDYIRRVYERMGLDLGMYQGNESWFLPIPATYIVGRDGVIVSAFVDTDFRRRMEPSDIVEALDALKHAA